MQYLQRLPFGHFYTTAATKPDWFKDGGHRAFIFTPRLTLTRGEILEHNQCDLDVS